MQETRDEGVIPGSGRSPGGGHGNSLQYSCLKNPMDRGIRWATVHRVAKNWTWLKQFSTHTHTSILQCHRNTQWLVCAVKEHFILFLVKDAASVVWERLIYVCLFISVICTTPLNPCHLSLSVLLDLALKTDASYAL